MTESGVPAGARWSPIPDVVLGEALPDLPDAVTVKLLLHVLWRTGRREPQAPPALRQGDLEADSTLARGLHACGVEEKDRSAVLTAAVDRLADDGWLLVAAASGATGAHRWIWPNTPEGRQHHERWRDGEAILPDAPLPLPAAAEPRRSAYALFEDNVGPLTPLIAEELAEAIERHGEPWVEDAIRLAVANNVRRWSYVRAILERWGREGRVDEVDRADSGRGRERDAQGPYAAYIRH